MVWYAHEETEIYASGRTDAGVHAYGQVAHFDLSKDINLFSARASFSFWSLSFSFSLRFASASFWRASSLAFISLSFCCSLASAMQRSSIATTHPRSGLTHCLCKVRWGVQQWCLSVPLPLDAGKISIILLPLEPCFQMCKSLFTYGASQVSQW